jgi:hypothetical protein
MQMAENQRRNIELQNMKLRQADGMTDVHIMETTGISDLYSYFNPNIALELNVAQPKNYVPAYAEEHINTLRSEYEEANKMNPLEMKTKINEIENSRIKDTSMIKQSMEREQIERVIKSKF